MRAPAIVALLGLLVPAGATPKKPARDPLAVVVLIDRSASMKGDPLEVAKDAVVDVVTALDPADAIGVIAFDDNAIAHALLQHSARPDELARDIADIAPGSAQTDYAAGLAAAANMLRLVKARKKHVILISDGGPTDGTLAAATVRKAGITISVIALAESAPLRGIADVGGGRVYGVGDVGMVPKVARKEVRELQRK